MSLDPGQQSTLMEIAGRLCPVAALLATTPNRVVKIGVTEEALWRRVMSIHPAEASAYLAAWQALQGRAVAVHHEGEWWSLRVARRYSPTRDEWAAARASALLLHVSLSE